MTFPQSASKKSARKHCLNRLIRFDKFLEIESPKNRQINMFRRSFCSWVFVFILIVNIISEIITANDEFEQFWCILQYCNLLKKALIAASLNMRACSCSWKILNVFQYIKYVDWLYRYFNHQRSYFAVWNYSLI